MKVYKKIVWLVSIYIEKDKFALAGRDWVKDLGDSTLRKIYPLNESSIVFDVGGYKGEFAIDIYKKYGSNIYIFEPVKQFYDEIQSKFILNDKVHVYDFGLSDHDATLNICLADDGSSVYDGNKSNLYEEVHLKSFLSFCDAHGIESIDLLKINIEGGEFPLLFALIDSPIIRNIQNIQVQFHAFVDNAEQMREQIRTRLSDTHHLTYDYYFIWENWELNTVDSTNK
jgi:FkbM family methyltransferase